MQLDTCSMPAIWMMITAIHHRNRNTNSRVWLTNITCDNSSLHLLHCNYSVIPGDQGTQLSACGEPQLMLLVQCGK